MKNLLFIPALVFAAMISVHCPQKEEQQKPAVEQITPENAEQAADQILKEIDDL